jgi:hypothetical protein
MSAFLFPIDEMLIPGIQGMAPLGIKVYTGNWQSLTGKRQTNQKGGIKRAVLNPCLRRVIKLSCYAEMSQIEDARTAPKEGRIPRVSIGFRN